VTARSCAISSRFSAVIYCFATRKAEVLNSLIMNITAKANDTNDIFQTFRWLLLSKRLQYVICIVCFGRDIHYKIYCFLQSRTFTCTWWNCRCVQWRNWNAHESEKDTMFYLLKFILITATSRWWNVGVGGEFLEPILRIHRGWNTGQRKRGRSQRARSSVAASRLF